MAKDKDDKAPAAKAQPNYIILGAIGVLAIGFFIGQWLMLDALSGRLDAVEGNLLERCSIRKVAPVVAAKPKKKKAAKKKAPKPENKAARAACEAMCDKALSCVDDYAAMMVDAPGGVRRKGENRT